MTTELSFEKPMMTYWWDENKKDIGMEHIIYELVQAKNAMIQYRSYLKLLRETDSEDKDRKNFYGFMKNAMLENFFLHFANIYNARIIQPFYDKKGVVYDIAGIVEKVKDQITTLTSRRTSRMDNKLMGAQDDMYHAWDWLEYAIGDFEELKDFDWEIPEAEREEG